MNKKIQPSALNILSVFALFGLFALFLFAPSEAKADFWDDFVDFLNPVEHVNNIIDGRPLDNLPPIPGFSNDSTTVYVNNQVQNPTVFLSANPSSVSFNGSSTISWNSNNATSCFASSGANGWAGNKSLSGSFFTGNLTNSTTFHITCSNSTGSANNSITVNVGNQQQNITVNISASPTSISFGQSSTLSWNSNNATSCSASGGTNGWSGNKNTSGTFFTGNLNNTTTFSINCNNNTSSASDSVTVFVDNQQQNSQVSVNISADDTRIDFEDSTRIRWNSDNADYCIPSDGTNDWDDEDINTSGSFDTDDLTRDETFRITCYNNNDSANDSVTIRVDDDDDDFDNNDDEPDVTTRNATNVTTGSATLNGRVDGNGSGTRAWFEYGTSTYLGYSTSESSYGSSSNNFNKNISGLIANTTYYFRAVAENREDTAYGSILSFNTGGNFINFYPPVNNQPTVVISTDQTSIPFNGATTIRWYTTDATSCNASGGSVGWAGAKNIGPGSFYTGLLTASRTFTITCSNNVGSSTDSVAVNVRAQVIATPASPAAPRPAATSLVLLTSSVNSNQPITPTLDNVRPRPGDEINYTVKYQNIGTGTITGLALRIDLPFEVNYMFSNGNNPIISGQTLVFNLGTLSANREGAVTVRARVRENIPAGTNLNFPATLSYIDPSGFPQSVIANVSAQIWSEPADISLEANVFGAGFLPTNLFGWLLLIVLTLILVLLAKYLFGPGPFVPLSRQTVTTFDQPSGKETTTTIH